MKINKLISVFLMLLFPYLAQAQYIEEIGSLETLFETRARSVLNTILRPTDYTLVVSVELDRDEQKLKEFRDDVDVQYLPGMPMMGDLPASPRTMNKLHELKARTEISIVLSRNVSPDVEKVLKDLVVSKLHLDTNMGDMVSVKRIELPADPKPEEKKPDTFPELTWKMWTLLVILALLALSGLMFWAWRRGKRDPNKDVNENHDYKHGEKLDIPNEAMGSPADPAPPVVAEEYVDIDLTAVKQHVLSIGATYPQMASRAVTEYCLNISAENMSYLMEHVGWDAAKALFSEVPALAWAKVGNAIKDRPQEVTVNTAKRAIHEAYKAILAAYVEHEMSSDENNPFSFILKMRQEERQQILDGESASRIAIFCLHAPAELTAEIIGELPPEVRVQVLGELSKIEKLPYEQVQDVISSMKSRADAMRIKPEPRIEGAQVLAKVIRGMSPEEEMDLLQLFANDNPSEFERIRNSMLVFDDLLLVPQDILSDILTPYDVEDLYAALFKTPASFYRHVLRAVPDRKAMVVEGELSSMVTIPQRKRTADLRREISKKTEAMLQSRAINVADLVSGGVTSMKVVQ